MNNTPTPLGCLLSPRAASQTIRSLQLRIAELERTLFILQHSQQAKADRTSRFRKEAERKAKHPAHVIQIWDEVPDPDADPYAVTGAPPDSLLALRYAMHCAAYSQGKATGEESDSPRPREGEGAGGEGSPSTNTSDDTPTLADVLFDPNRHNPTEPHV